MGFRGDRWQPQSVARQAIQRAPARLESRAPLYYKTDAFLQAHPFGAVPAAFSPDGKTGIFESNSIMRAVARLARNDVPVYGRDAFAASRIDSFLDVSLVFARESQICLLALRSGTLPAEIHAQAGSAFTSFMTGIDRALSATGEFLVGNDSTLADSCFAAELSLLASERLRAQTLAEPGLEGLLHARLATNFPPALSRFARLRKHPAFAPDMGLICARSKPKRCPKKYLRAVLPGSLPRHARPDRPRDRIASFRPESWRCR